MKILVVNVYYAPDTFGGATIVAEDVSEVLAYKYKHEVCVFSACSRPEFTNGQLVKTTHNNINNFQCNIQNRNEIDIYMGNPHTTHSFKTLLGLYSPDIVHIHCIQDIGADIIKVCKEQDKKVVLTLHDFWWLCEYQFMIQPDSTFCDQNPVAKANCLSCSRSPSYLEKRFDYLHNILTLPDAITAPSSYTKELYESSVDGISVQVIKNGIRPPASEPKRNTPHNTTVYGFLGGPGPVKGFDQLLSAVNLIESTNSIFRLVDASPSGDWFDGIDFSSLPGTWEIVPRFSQNEMDDFYSSIDILLFPSQWKETFGLTVREAISRKIWVIASNGGGAVEDCVDNVNSNLINYGESSINDLVTYIKLYENTKPVSPGSSSISTFYHQAELFNNLFNEIIRHG